MTEHKTTFVDRDGVRKTLIHDDETNRLVVQTEQVLDDILDGIARDRELHRSRGDVKHAARIPTFIYEQLVERGIAGDEDAMRKWLNSSEATPWRVWQGDL